MTKKQAIQLGVLVVVSVILNILLYSRVGLALRPSMDNPLLSAVLVTEVIGNIVVFIYVAYRILIKAQTTQIYDTKTFVKEKDYTDALEDCKSKKIFLENIEKAETQMSRLQTKYDTINVILLQHFQSSSMTYEKFMKTVDMIKNLFFNNLRKMINRMSIFNEDEYKELKRTDASDINLQIYKEHMEYVNQMLMDNNVILAKLDKLILEISKLNDGEEDKFEHLQIMEEIDDLINKTKLYS